MIREPRQTPKTVQTNVAKKSRFQVVKLEERIAPACHTNPHGKEVGCGKPGKF